MCCFIGNQGCCFGGNVWPTPFHVLVPRNNSSLSELTRIAGIGLPGATIEVEVDNLGVLTTTVAPNGTWSFIVNYRLPNGFHSIKVVHRSGLCVETRFISIRIIDAPALPPPVILSPAEGSTINSPQLFVTGTAIPGYIVTVCLTNGACVATTADANGNFAIQYPYSLSNGQYRINAFQQDPLTGATSRIIGHLFFVNYAPL
ncbi:MAG TPA: hypothetical protein PKE04_07785 [Clostridia bacterium]|nr:hypothetical protein [Clostridia bacterium]